MSAITIRTLSVEESSILLRATVENFNWQGQWYTSEDVLASPQLGRYPEFIPKRGDFGFLASMENETVGVVWAQFFPKSAGTWGFVAPKIPELSIWVEAAYRRRGVGRALIYAVQHAARMRGLLGLSLSVEQGNPAHELYRDTGFVAVAGREQDGVMLWKTD